MLRLLPSFTLLCASLLPAQSRALPRTVPETTGYAETSRAADVQRFVDACTGLPHGDRLEVKVAGKSSQGHAMLLVKAALPAPSTEPRLRALVIGNIHGGEVEGKEAVQELIRELAAGEHEDVLRRIELWFVPIYNVDGNEAVAAGNRRGQNGPDVVGQRHTGQDLDLNRDFVKADAPETQAMLRLFQDIDPHLFVDLHTTNGSYHGYDLTFAPSLSPNLDDGVDRFSRELLVTAAAAMRRDGFEAFDYGNFETRDWDGGGAPESSGTRGWYTYDWRARYGVNYFALRNRIAVLSEAYSYADFQTRIAATRAFVLGLLHGVAARHAELLALADVADRRLCDGDPVWFGRATTFGDPERLPILVGEVDRVDGPDGRPLRFVQQEQTTTETMPVFRRFRANAWRRLPTAWAVATPPAEVLRRLRWHGVAFETLDAPRTVSAQAFAIAKTRRPKRPYQGHQAVEVEGDWLAAERVELPAGAIVVPARQRLGRVAATLLEPDSEDGLTTWNFFDAGLGERHPVLRVVE